MDPRMIKEQPPMPPEAAIGPKGTEDVMRENRSIFNPTDLAMAAEEGITDISIRQFFEMNGIDVEGPVTQMIDFVQDQKQKASGVHKAQALAQSQPPQDPMAGMGTPGGAPPVEGQDPLDRLMQ